MHWQMSDDKNQSSFSSSLSSKRRTDQPFLLWRCNHLQVWSERPSALSGSNYIEGPLLSITSKCLLAPRARCIGIHSADHSLTGSRLQCDSLRLWYVTFLSLRRTSTGDMLPFCTSTYSPADTSLFEELCSSPFDMLLPLSSAIGNCLNVQPNVIFAVRLCQQILRIYCAHLI